MTLLTGRGAVYTRIDDALARSGEMAMQAYCQETFSVGGVLLDSNGQELMLMHNNVVIERFTYDPTAHGERQLVDWYFEQIAAGVALPPAEEMTVVTSLDPCCMCTGALLRAGFKVIVGAFDRFSGINYNTEANYPSLTNEQRSRALANFSYPQATGESCFVRPATSAQPPMFFIDQATTDKTLALCESIFTTSLNSVQQQISNDLPPEALCDPATLPDDHPVVAALRAVYPQSLTYRAPSRGQPDVALANFMIPVIEQDRQRGGKGDAVALLDIFGNLLLCMPGNISQSPIQTAFMQTTRTWAQLRHQLFLQQGEAVLPFIGHCKYGTLVLARGPDSSDEGLMTLGAYGSTMEGALPSDNPRQFQYIVPMTDDAALQAYCRGLPPLYSEEIVIHPWQVEDESLIEAISEALSR